MKKTTTHSKSHNPLEGATTLDEFIADIKCLWLGRFFTLRIIMQAFERHGYEKSQLFIPADALANEACFISSPFGLSDDDLALANDSLLPQLSFFMMKPMIKAYSGDMLPKPLLTNINTLDCGYEVTISEAILAWFKQIPSVEAFFYDNFNGERAAKVLKATEQLTDLERIIILSYFARLRVLLSQYSGPQSSIGFSNEQCVQMLNLTNTKANQKKARIKVIEACESLFEKKINSIPGNIEYTWFNSVQARKHTDIYVFGEPAIFSPVLTVSRAYADDMIHDPTQFFSIDADK